MNECDVIRNVRIFIFYVIKTQVRAFLLLLLHLHIKLKFITHFVCRAFLLFYFFLSSLFSIEKTELHCIERTTTVAKH